MSKLIADRIRVADYIRQLLRVTPEAGTTIEEVLKPDYWVHVAPKAKLGDVLEIFPEDGSWFVQAVVVSCSNVHLKLHVLNKVVINEVKAESKKDDKKDEPFRVEFKGPQRKWSVIRKDGVYIKEGFEDRRGAEAWLAENQKDIA